MPLLRSLAGSAGYGTPILDVRYESHEEWCEGSNGGSNIFVPFTLTRFHWITADGNDIELVDALTNGTPHLTGQACVGGNVLHGPDPTPFNRQKTFVSKDGSTVTFVADEDVYDLGSAGPISGTLYYKNGIRYRIEGGKVQWLSDRNGNLITLHYQTPSQPPDVYGRPVAIDDPLGRRITIQYGQLVHNGNPDDDTAEDVITYAGVQGQRTVTVVHKRLVKLLHGSSAVEKVKELFPATSYSAPYAHINDAIHNPLLPAEVIFPNGKNLNFWYNKFGELSKVKLPTDGGVEYDWMGYTADGTGLYGELLIYRRVSARRVYDAGWSLLAQTEYSVPLLDQMPSNLVVTVAEKDLGGSTLRTREHSYHGNPKIAATFPPLGYPGWREGREIQEVVKEGGSVLQTVSRLWEQRGSNNEAVIPSQESTPPNDPRLRKVSTILGALTSHTHYTYSVDAHNNVATVCDTDFGTETATRCKAMSYVTASSYTASPVHLRGLVQSESVVRYLPTYEVESTVTYPVP